MAGKALMDSEILQIPLGVVRRELAVMRRCLVRTAQYLRYPSADRPCAGGRATHGRAQGRVDHAVGAEDLDTLAEGVLHLM